MRLFRIVHAIMAFLFAGAALMLIAIATRIGWIAFDENYTRVVDRCIEPLLVPPPPKERAGTDIAFAASCLDRSPDILLYYSLEDRLLRRAVVRQLRPA